MSSQSFHDYYTVCDSHKYPKRLGGVLWFYLFHKQYQSYSTNALKTMEMQNCELYVNLGILHVGNKPNLNPPVSIVVSRLLT